MIRFTERKHCTINKASIQASEINREGMDKLITKAKNKEQWNVVKIFRNMDLELNIRQKENYKEKEGVRITRRRKVWELRVCGLKVFPNSFNIWAPKLLKIYCRFSQWWSSLCFCINLCYAWVKFSLSKPFYSLWFTLNYVQIVDFWIQVDVYVHNIVGRVSGGRIDIFLVVLSGIFGVPWMMSYNISLFIVCFRLCTSYFWVFKFFWISSSIYLINFLFYDYKTIFDAFLVSTIYFKAGGAVFRVTILTGLGTKCSLCIFDSIGRASRCSIKSDSTVQVMEATNTTAICSLWPALQTLLLVDVVSVVVCDGCWFVFCNKSGTQQLSLEQQKNFDHETFEGCRLGGGTEYLLLTCVSCTNYYHALFSIVLQRSRKIIVWSWHFDYFRERSLLNNWWYFWIKLGFINMECESLINALLIIQIITLEYNSW